MRQLAEALGCSPKTPYRYFKDKADLFRALVHEAHDERYRLLQEAASRREAAIRQERLDTPHRFCLWMARELLSRWRDPQERALMRLGHGEAMRGGSSALPATATATPSAIRRLTMAMVSALKSA